jgi:hypothetical protein
MKRIKLVEQLKTAGNDAFKQGKNEEAIAKYTEAMDADPENETMRTILFSNRAAAYVKVRLSPSLSPPSSLPPLTSPPSNRRKTTPPPSPTATPASSSTTSTSKPSVRGRGRIWRRNLSRRR